MLRRELNDVYKLLLDSSLLAYSRCFDSFLFLRAHAKGGYNNFCSITSSLQNNN